jgi:hypothetical protein
MRPGGSDFDRAFDMLLAVNLSEIIVTLTRERAETRWPAVADTDVRQILAASNFSATLLQLRVKF